MAWARDGMLSILRSSPPAAEGLQEMRGKTLSTSTNFSGVDAPGTAARLCANAINRAFKFNDSSSRFAIELTWGCDRNRACIEELLNMTDGPGHVFNDVLSFLPADTAHALDSMGPEEMRATLLKHTVVDTARCCRHGKCCPCRAQHGARGRYPMH